MPTDVGRVVNKFLTEHFTRYVDYDFTAGLESSLDEIAENNKEWVPLLKNFWDDFNKTINEKSNIDRAEITQEAIHEDCPKCGKPLFSRLGRRGKLLDALVILIVTTLETLMVSQVLKTNLSLFAKILKLEKMFYCWLGPMDLIFKLAFKKKIAKRNLSALVCLKKYH